MRTITVKKTQLLETLKKNRDSHRDNFLKAQEGFRQEVIEQLDEALKSAREGRKVTSYIHIPEPQDHTKDYDVAISMLEWETVDTVSLEKHDFERFVNDDWEWKQEWIHSNTAYMTKAAK